MKPSEKELTIIILHLEQCVRSLIHGSEKRRVWWGGSVTVCVTLELVSSVHTAAYRLTNQTLKGDLQNWPVHWLSKPKKGTCKNDMSKCPLTNQTFKGNVQRWPFHWLTNPWNRFLGSLKVEKYRLWGNPSQFQGEDSGCTEHMKNKSFITGSLRTGSLRYCIL